MKIAILLAVATAALVGAAPDMTSKKDQMEYFSQFGYMGEKSPDPRIQEMTTDEQYKAAIKEFQRFANLKVTGEMDEETIEKMKQPRCGMPDMMNKNNLMKRKKRFTPEGSKWENNELTYFIKNFTPDLNKDTQVNEIKRAFDVWSMASPLKFRRVYRESADIIILFGPGEHGDGIPFDGPSGTLAHAFFPRYGGDAHFDEDESWTAKTARGINLFQVAAHEFGHSLGLSHSKDNGALMAPFYAGYQPDFMLHSDDIAGIQHIYGKPNTDPTTPPPTPPKSTMDPDNMPSFCDDGTVDAVARSFDGLTYIFKGSQWFRLNQYGVQDGFPRELSELNLPSNLDAALFIPPRYEYNYFWVWKTDRWVVERKRVQADKAALWVFKGSDCWMYDEQTSIFTKYSIYDKFKGIPADLDAAFVWGGNNKVYFVKGSQYYRWEYTNRVESSYPRSVSVWGMDRMDGALQWEDGKTYFFKDDKYYRYDDRNYRIPDTYPRSTAKYWYGCTGSLMDEMEGNNDSDFFLVANSAGIVKSSHVILGLVFGLISSLFY